MKTQENIPGKTGENYFFKEIFREFWNNFRKISKSTENLLKRTLDNIREKYFFGNCQQILCHFSFLPYNSLLLFY